jgi:hypothetical protein
VPHKNLPLLQQIEQEKRIYKLVILISYLATRKLTTPGIQSNPDEAIEKTKQQYR